VIIGVEISVVVLFVVVAAAAWIVIHALEATGRLDDARGDIARLRADLVTGQSPQADLLASERDTAAADHDTHDFVWGAASWLPPVRTVQGVTSALSLLAHQALPPLAQVGPSLQPGRLRVARNKLALAPIEAAAPVIRSAATATATARAQIAALPSGWFNPISSARDKVLSQLTSLSGQVDDASRFATVGPAMLGRHGVRRYFVGIQNNSESRATGGLVAAYAIVTADHGRIEVVARGNDSQLLDASAPTYQPSTGYQREYGNYEPTQRWITSNVSPNFPDAADNWAHLWEAQSGEHIDGSFGVDPYGLAAMLGAVGPVTVPGYPGQYTSSNLAQFIEQTEYVEFPGLDNALRKNFVSKVAGAVLDKLLSGSGAPQAIATALGQSAGEGHLAFWSARPHEEASILGTPLAGALPQTAAPFASVSVDNAFAGKLDYYLNRTLTYQAGGCSAGRRSSTITVTLEDAAPLHGLPAYVRYGGSGASLNVESVPRDRLFVFIHATDGAALVSATLDGRPVQVSPGVELGHPVYLLDVLLQPQVPRTIQLTLNEPASAGPASTKIQPLARPQRTVLAVAAC
jgi:hypothetical protein